MPCSALPTAWCKQSHAPPEEPPEKGPCILAPIRVCVWGRTTKSHGVSPKHKAVGGEGGDKPRELVQTPQGKGQSRHPRLFPAVLERLQRILHCLYCSLSTTITLGAVDNAFMHFNSTEHAQGVEEIRMNDGSILTHYLVWDPHEESTAGQKGFSLPVTGKALLLPQNRQQIPW